MISSRRLAARAPDPGPNPTDWPGLTLYRFTAPTAPQWDQVGALSICVVAQGRKAVTVDGVRHYYDPFHYFVLRRSLTFQVEILTASVEKPYLAFVLQVDPSLVRRISADMIDRAATTFHRPLPEDVADPGAPQRHRAGSRAGSRSPKRDARSSRRSAFASDPGPHRHGSATPPPWLGHARIAAG